MVHETRVARLWARLLVGCSLLGTVAAIVCWIFGGLTAALAAYAAVVAALALLIFGRLGTTFRFLIPLAGTLSSAGPLSLRKH